VVTDKIGAGLGIYSESLGITNKLGAYAMGSYQLKIADEHYLRFGLSAGLLQFSINDGEVDASDLEDPLLVNKNFSSTAVDGTFGIGYVNKNLELGLGINQILGNKSKITDDVNFQLSRGLIGSAKYRLFINSKKDLSIEPMLLVRYSDVEMPQEAILIINWKDQFYVAPSYKSSGAIGASFAVANYKGFTIGYSFETIVNKEISAIASGSHEIMLGYSFDIRSKAMNRVTDKIDALEEALKKQANDQAGVDSLQNEGIKKNKENLEKLKKQLRDAGVLKDGKVSDYKQSKEGFYNVIASVKKSRVDRDKLKSDYIDKGFKILESDNTEWIYVYDNYTTDFRVALAKLKELRSGAHPTSWIFVLK